MATPHRERMVALGLAPPRPEPEPKMQAPKKPAKK